MGQDHVWCQSQQFRSGGPRLLNVAWCPTIVHANATAARPAQLLQGALEHCSANLRFWIAFGQSHQHTHAAHPVRLLCARRERPHYCRAAEQRDELAALHLRGHSMTSSARASKVGGTSRPIVLAAFRLITSSNFTGT